MRDSRFKALSKALLLIGLTGLAASLYAALNMAFDGLPFADYIRWIVSFMCFGLLLGGILAFDSEASERFGNRPFLRALIGALSGAAIGGVWNWPSDGIVLAGVIGLVLGLLGMVWAKHVDF